MLWVVVLILIYEKNIMASLITIGIGVSKKYKLTWDVNTTDGTRKRKSKTFPAGTLLSTVKQFKLKVEQEYALGELQIVENTRTVELLKRQGRTMKNVNLKIQIGLIRDTFCIKKIADLLCCQKSLAGDTRNLCRVQIFHTAICTF